MGIANFFGKNALAAHQVLNGMSTETLSALLSGQTVGIAFDRHACATAEGRWTTSLAVDLAARLYPRLAIFPIGESDVATRAFADELKAAALAINPALELHSQQRRGSHTVVVGSTPLSGKVASLVYAGSSGWVAAISPDTPMRSGRSANPIGAGAAACFAMANIFRAVFKAHLPAGEADSQFALSFFDYKRRDVDWGAGGGPALEDVGIDLGETIIAGLGAIGNAAVWTLARVPRLRGALELVDHQKVTLSNLQRYVLTNQTHANGTVGKALRATEALRSGHPPGASALVVTFHEMCWGHYLRKRNDFRITRLATAFDTIGDRIAAQASLPARLLNAWTQLGDLGVSRHLEFGEQPCVGCLYIPKGGGKSDAETIGENLGFPGAPDEIKQLLHSNAPIDEQFIREVARRRNILAVDKLDVLLRFVGVSLREFYNEAFCGGVILELGGTVDGSAGRVEAPMAFQSALAGIMLAAEIVIDAAGFRPEAQRSSPPTRTVIDLLRPLAPILEPPIGRRSSGCLCNDDDYVSAWNMKFGPDSSRTKSQRDPRAVESPDLVELPRPNGVLRLYRMLAEFIGGNKKGNHPSA